MPLRIVYFGQSGILSSQPLAHLLEHKHNVIAVVTAAAGESLRLPVTQPGGRQTTTDRARAAGIPILTMRSEHHEALIEQLRSLNPDVILVSCFPYQLPRELYELPAHGSYNLHPSLLPRYRGPEPLFWQYRHGEVDSGITLHKISDALDAGDIVLQELVTLSTGMSGSEAEASMARAGSRLLLQALEQLNKGMLTGTKQDERLASYYPYPAEKEFLLDQEWSARRAWHFICGTRHWGHAYCYDSGDDKLYIKDATACIDDGHLSAPVEKCGDEVKLQFNPGVLQAHVNAIDST